MNSEEGMSMAKMAVTVLLVVLVISAVAGIVYAAYSWFTSGTDKLADNVTSISDSAMSQYDDQTVSGSDVLSALKQYRNSDIVICISNLKNQNGTFSSTQTDTKCYAYCALPKNATAAAEFTLNYGDVGGSVGEQYHFKDGFKYATDGISIERNTNFSPATTKSNADAFVKQSASFYANLVYDASTGDVAGIIFRQMN